MFLDSPPQLPVTIAIEPFGEVLNRVVAARAGRVDQEGKRWRPAVGGVQDRDDQVEMLSQYVGVVGLRALDRLNRAGGHVGGLAPQRLPTVGGRMAWVKQHERPTGRGRQLAQLELVGRVTLLVDQQRAGALGSCPRREETPGGRGLAGTGAAAHEHMVSLSERQPSRRSIGMAHRHVLHLPRPWTHRDHLPLGADVGPLARLKVGGWLPQPATI
jgi:hypothetical protein